MPDRSGGRWKVDRRSHRRRSDTALTPAKLEAVLRSLRRGTPRPDALRQAGVDPVVFAAEYRSSSLIREAIVRAEGRSPSYEVTIGSQAFLPPLPRTGAEADIVGTEPRASPEAPSQFSGWTLWLVVVLPLLVALALLAAGAAPNLPPLADSEHSPAGVGGHHEWVDDGLGRLANSTGWYEST